MAQEQRFKLELIKLNGKRVDFCYSALTKSGVLLEIIMEIRQTKLGFQVVSGTVKGFGRPKWAQKNVI